MKLCHLLSMIASLNQCAALSTQSTSKFATSSRPKSSHGHVKFCRRNVIRPSILGDDRIIMEYATRVFAISAASVVGIIRSANSNTEVPPSSKAIKILTALGLIGPTLLSTGVMIRYSMDTPDSSLGALILYVALFALVDVAGIAIVIKIANE